MEIDRKTHHVGILASPGIGHIIPILSLAKRIVSILQGYQVTVFFVPTNPNSNAEAEIIRSQGLTQEPRIQIIQLHAPEYSSSPDTEVGVEERTSVTVKQSLPSLRAAILAMVQKPDVLIVDIFGTDAFDLADELGMLKYVFITTTAMFTALALYLPTLDKEIEGQYVDQKHPIQVPGCKPLQIGNLIDPMQDRNNKEYKWLLYQASRYPMANGILMNTCEELEPQSINSLREHPIMKHIGTPPVYPIGPITRLEESSMISGNKHLEWLDKQPSGSVLFVSFGSGGTLSAEQIMELAWGLELSEQRFIWVVREPTNKSFGTYFRSGGGGGDPSDYLPAGFLTRTSTVGLVVPSWCPQFEILSHGSTGGCLTHCGWNTILECITHGLPMIAWPLYAEQRVNASMLTEDLGVAIQPTILPTKGLVGRAEIEKMARLVMKEDGNVLRLRAKELKETVLGASAEGGSSYKSLLEVSKEWKASIVP